MTSQSKDNQMNKRGQFEPVSAAIGGVFVLILIIVGGISSHKILSENRYVGDNSTKQYFDLSSCVISIEESKLIKFESREKAIEGGYLSATCNR